MTLPHSEVSAAVIAEYDRYLGRTVAKRTEAVGGLPLCPFAAAARRSKRITWEVGPIVAEMVIARALEWCATAKPNAILIFLDPNRTLPIADLQAAETAARDALKPIGWIAFTGHPENDYQMAGMFTRRDPFPSLRVYNRVQLKSGELKLEAGERYYAGIDPRDLEEWEES